MPNVKHFLIIVETILNTIFCQNGVIPVVSAWAGIAGLFVAVWTLWNVRSVRETLKRYKKKRSLHEQLPQFCNDLERICFDVSEAAYPTDGRMKLDIPKMLRSLERVASICEEIAENDVNGSIPSEKTIALRSLCKAALSRDSHERKTLQNDTNAKLFKMNRRRFSPGLSR